MDDQSDKREVDEVVSTQAQEDNHSWSEALECTPSTTLVEVAPGVAAVFGEVPDGLEPISLDLMPPIDRTELSAALNSLGNAGTIVGNLTEAASNVQGLFRVNEATLSLLRSGGQMAAKDGAKLGAIFKNGELVAQARLIPASMTVGSALASIGPAVAMIALQMQLGEISGLVRTNIQLTTQALATIRSEQWAKLTALVKTVDGAFQEALAIGTVNESVWDRVSHVGTEIDEKQHLYRGNVDAHVKELKKLDGHARRQYLETNAQAIIFDSHALLSSLKMYAQYQSLRASRARVRSANDESEARIFEQITQKTSTEIDRSFREIKQLTQSLVRELRIIAELPGRATAPLTKKRKDAKASEFTCQYLLEVIEPLADKLQQAVKITEAPEAVCAPAGLALDPYLKIVRWFLEEGEVLRSIAFPYEVGPHNFTGVLPAVLAKRVDATWDAFAPRKASALVEKLAPSAFIAVTNRRIITAAPGNLLKRGEIGPVYSLDKVSNVRVRSHKGKNTRPTIDVATVDHDLHWMFPDSAAREDINSLAAILSERTSSAVSATTATKELAEAANDTDS